MNFELDAYPQYVIYLLSFIGGILAIIRPHWLFYAVVFALVITDSVSYTFTRIQFIGPYFNFFDFLLILGLGSTLFFRGSEKVPLPTLFYILTAYLICNFLFSYSYLGTDYGFLRLAHQVLSLPLFWVLGQRGINTRSDAKVVLWLVVIGCFVQAVRQCIYVVFSPMGSHVQLVRTIRYFNAGLVIVPLCALLYPFYRKRWFQFLLYADAAVSFVALILTQTRSFLVPQVIVILVAGFFVARKQTLRIALPLLIVGGFFVFYFRLISKGVDIPDLLLHGRLFDFSSGTGREEAIAAEMDAWVNSNLIFGRGLGFMFGREFRGNEIAWAHNGYVAYLANLGLLGLYLYAIELPRMTFQNARVLLRSADEIFKAYGAMLVAMTWYVIIESALSGGLFGSHAFSFFIVMLGGVRSLAAQSEFINDAPAPAVQPSKDLVVS